MTDEVKEVKQFAREVKLYQADNGYLVNVGCNWFVCEGSAEKVCDDVQSYLSFQPEVVAKYNYKNSDAFRLDAPTLCPPCDECSNAYALTSTAFALLTIDHLSIKPVETKYAVTNGYVVVSHKDKTATVFQQEV